uniref:Uncharacterized protein n=1 Tax=Triticum urartu TaxID=4572 RepID=A0A8R7UKY5_TRIUA
MARFGYSSRGRRHCRPPLMAFLGIVAVMVFLYDEFCSVRPEGTLQNNPPSYSLHSLEIFSPFGSWHRGGPRPSAKVCIWDPTGSKPLPYPLVSCQALPIPFTKTQEILFIRRSGASVLISRKLKQAIVEPHALSSMDWCRFSSLESRNVSCPIFCSGLSGVSSEIPRVSRGSHPSQPPSLEAYIVVFGSRSSPSRSSSLVHIPELCHQPYEGLISLLLMMLCVILVIDELVPFLVQRLSDEVVLVLFSVGGHHLHHRRSAMGPV